MEGAAHICNGLKNNKSVTSFGLCKRSNTSLDKNGIEVECAKYFAELLLKNSSITYLALGTLT